MFLCLANLSAPVRAQVGVQSEGATANTNFSASPITPGFWLFSNKENANTDEILRGCRGYVTFQFQDGYYFTLKLKKHPPTAEPTLSAASVQEVGRCKFDRDTQSEHCDVAVTEDSGAANKGFIDIGYSKANGSLKMTIRGTTTDGSNAGKSETF